MKEEKYFYGGDKMKIFISWSGELSKKVAEELKKWIPCIIQSASVFYSPEDIEKGQNWNSKITEELSNCNYGIICLTKENKSAPWVNFEAGAIAKTLNSRITALMININPSDIQGPLSSYQATKLDKDEFLKLFISINNCQENPINEDILSMLFNAVWEKIEEGINGIIKATPTKAINEKKNDSTEVLENILQAIREQSRVISNPKELLPKEYLEEVLSGNISENREDLADYTYALLESIHTIFLIYKKNKLWNENEEMKNVIRRIVYITKNMINTHQIDECTSGKKALYRLSELENIINEKTVIEKNIFKNIYD